MKIMILEIDLTEEDNMEGIALESERSYLKAGSTYNQIAGAIRSFSITESDLIEHIWQKHGSESAAMSHRFGNDLISWFTCSKREALNFINSTITYQPNVDELACFIESYLPKKKTNPSDAKKGKKSKKKTCP